MATKKHWTELTDEDLRNGLIGYDPELGKTPQWGPIMTTVRQAKIYELVRSLTFYWGTILSDKALLHNVLAEPNDFVLIDSKTSTKDTPYFDLCVKKEDGTLEYHKVMYHKKTLCVYLEKNRKEDLVPYLRDSKLMPMPRQYIFDRKQLVHREHTNPLAVPHHLSTIGEITFHTLEYDSKRKLPVTALKYRVSSTDKKQAMAVALDRKHFGNERIWRLMGVSGNSGPHDMVLIFEDITFGPLSGFICDDKGFKEEDLGKEETRSLLKSYHGYAVQMCEAMRYLEKHNFIHHNLTIDSFLLSYDLQIKLALFCYDPATLYNNVDDFGDLDRYRWVSPAYLPVDGKVPINYDNAEMMYTFGVVLWSLYHGAALPYCDLTEEELKDPVFRKNITLAFSKERITRELKLVIRTSCWGPTDDRYTFQELKRRVKSMRGW